jgi:hypothetical protein
MAEFVARFSANGGWLPANSGKAAGMLAWE